VEGDWAGESNGEATAELTEEAEGVESRVVVRRTAPRVGCTTAVDIVGWMKESEIEDRRKDCRVGQLQIGRRKG